MKVVPRKFVSGMRFSRMLVTMQGVRAASPSTIPKHSSHGQITYAGPLPGQCHIHSPGIQSREIHPMLFQCWASVEDGGLTLKQHWVDASCLLGRYLILVKKPRWPIVGSMLGQRRRRCANNWNNIGLTSRVPWETLPTQHQTRKIHPMLF